MSDIKLLTYENIPCWYEFGWDLKNTAIIFRLHKKAISNNNMCFGNRFPLDAPIVKILTERLGLKRFYGSLNADFGFGGVLRCVGEDEEFIIFSVSLPSARKNTGDQCLLCGGTGRSDIYDDRKCGMCGGDGKEWEFDNILLFNISASFVVMLTAFSEYYDYDTKCERLQLMTVDLTAEATSMYGFCIGGKFGVELVKWMSTFEPHTEMTEMTTAMKEAYWHMSGTTPRKYEQFRASVDYENGWLNVSCPGDACGLNPSNGRFEANEGYSFASHNTDTPIQQLTLLAGLAALHDKARKEI